MADELGSIIVDKSPGYTKVVEHVMLDELDYVWCLYFLQGNNFHPFREVISYAKMKQCPLDVGGMMGPITSIPPHSNGHEENIG